MKVFVPSNVRATLAAALALAASASTAQAAPSGLNAYSVRAAEGNALRLLAQEGFDISEGARGDRIEIVATAAQARGLHKFGLDPTLERSGSARAARIRPDGSYEVFRPYWDNTYAGTVGGVPGGPARETLYEEFSRLAGEHPDIVKYRSSGTR